MSQTKTPPLALEIIAKAKAERATKLQLGRCGLTEIPPEVLELDWLEELDLRNEWREDGKEIFAENNGDHNQIKRISNLTNLKKLRVLRISGYWNQKQAIKEIPGNFLPDSLEVLNLSHNLIIEIRGLEKLVHLSELDLSSNQITEIKGLEKPTLLSMLDLSSNRIIEIKGLDALVLLSKLNLSSNQIITIRGLEKLILLSTLNLNSNQIIEIKGLEKLAQLSFLNLGGNQITEIRGLEKLIQLSTLNLGRNKISEIKGLERLSQLSTLNLWSNRITEIKRLEKLVKLSMLSLGDNRISEIKGLENLMKLSILNLWSNRITEIKGLEYLANLYTLDLFKNQITEIKGLEQLVQLSTLDLRFNQIAEIKGLEQLVKLSTLNLGRNQISYIKGLENLNNLSRLYLAYNQISEINKLSVPFLEQLSQIDLRDNPIKGVPIKDLSNRQAILGYLKSLQDMEVKLTNFHLKLNIIGTGRIGKSQLFNFFNDQQYLSKQPETHGTQTAYYQIPDTAYHATIWDFGGQSYHHGFHYLFLRPNDFYLVLWRNIKDTEPDYAYWLGTARHFAKNEESGKYTMPLMLVQNQWATPDEPDPDFIPDKIAYPSSEKLVKYQLGLADVFCTDVKSLFDKEHLTIYNRYFLDTLHARIIEHCRQINNLPKVFVEIKKKLDENPVEGIYMTRMAFRNLYAGQIGDDDKFAYLLQYLEFTGNIITFREIETLNEYVFTNPPKLSDWIYQTVLDDKFKKRNKGKIGAKEIQRKTGSEEKAMIFLELMNKFRLVFEQPFSEKDDDPGESYYIIPQFLPEYNHSFKQVLLELLPFTFSIRFSDFIHEGRFFKFIAEYGKFAKDNSAYWKYGLLFGYELKHASSPTNFDQKEKNIIRVLAYYVADKRQLMVHIEDKKGRAEVAKKLFEFFASEEIPGKGNFSNTISSPRDIIQQKEELESVTNERFHLTEQVAENEQRSMEIIFQEDLLLCTNGHNYFDVKETKANIAANNFFGTCNHAKVKVKLDFMTINLLSSETKRKLRIFFSYSHKDEQYRDELDKHFTMLKRNCRIETWHDRKIMPGDNWDATIKQQLETADIVLIMISADLLNSDYIWEQELGIVQRRLENKDGIKAIPIFVRPCFTEGLKFMDIQGAQQDDQGKLPWISSSADRDDTYTKIVQGIKKAIDAME